MPPEPVFSLCHLVVFFSCSDIEGWIQTEEERERRGEERGERGLGDKLLWVLHNTNILARAKIAPVEVAVKVSLSLIPFHCGVHVWSDRTSGSDRRVK